MPRATDPATHARQMGKLKAVMDAKIARATREKGLVVVHTGNGKGKTTAAVGMLVRALGHGFKCAVVQFVKGDLGTAETVLTAFAGGRLTWERVGEGFTWNTQDRDRDAAHAAAGWARVQALMADPDLRFLLLDELNIVLGHGYLPLEPVLAALRAKRADLHIVITGRGAPPDLIELADLVTEMKELKHPFKAGIKAQAGIEF
jgi:cob(I)alamin adenosyltransferase